MYFMYGILMYDKVRVENKKKVYEKSDWRERNSARVHDFVGV